MSTPETPETTVEVPKKWQRCEIHNFPFSSEGGKFSLYAVAQGVNITPQPDFVTITHIYDFKTGEELPPTLAFAAWLQELKQNYLDIDIRFF